MHNLKEIVNLQNLFVLAGRYLDMTTNPLKEYYCTIERVYFIYKLFILFISTFSFLLFLCGVSWREKGDELYVSIDILLFCFILCSILLT